MSASTGERLPTSFEANLKQESSTALNASRLALTEVEGSGEYPPIVTLNEVVDEVLLSAASEAFSEFDRDVMKTNYGQILFRWASEGFFELLPKPEISNDGQATVFDLGFRITAKGVRSALPYLRNSSNEQLVRLADKAEAQLAFTTA